MKCLSRRVDLFCTEFEACSSFYCIIYGLNFTSSYLRLGSSSLALPPPRRVYLVSVALSLSRVLVDNACTQHNPNKVHSDRDINTLSTSVILVRTYLSAGAWGSKKDTSELSATGVWVEDCDSQHQNSKSKAMIYWMCRLCRLSCLPVIHYMTFLLPSRTWRCGWIKHVKQGQVFLWKPYPFHDNPFSDIQWTYHSV